jgi:hypothetical protein
MTQWNNTRQVTNHLFLLLLLLLTGVAWGQSGTLSTTAFGMQCGPGSTENCPIVSGAITLPTEPGTLRLWDSEVNWSWLNPDPSGTGQWDFTNLNYYLYAIENASNVKDVIYTFGWTPCWDAGLSPNCGKPGGTAPNGTALPPTDIVTTSCGPNGTGSPTFNAFVQELTTYCAPASGSNPKVCVSDKIKYYEMWNEANTTNFWDITAASTSAQDLYCMAAPAAKIIKTNVTGAKILTPSINASNGYETWMEDWLGDEVSGGIISNLYNIHAYMKTQTPEYTYQNVVVNQLAPNSGGLVSGWTALPWLLSETNWDPSTLECDNSNTADCTGQVVRWQAILNSNGALNVSWYWWNATIGDLSSGGTYSAAYYYMMKYMVGGKFTSACSGTTGTTQTWTCPFTDVNGNSDLWVWTNTTTNVSYTATGYTNYWNLAGTCQAIPGSFSITDEPYLLVTTSCSVEP